jgi:predicted transposase/invertase (TIGR01784 family)
MAKHDEPYKRIFSHPEMVEDLLKGFVHLDWVKDCDFSTLEKQDGSFVSEKWQSRESDVIWRVRLNTADKQDSWLYLYLLLEFQSSPDHFMALRMLGYTSLFLQSLVDSLKLSSDDKLPPVLPMVIYNGKRRWEAPTQLADLMTNMPETLKVFQPQQQYWLLDENQCSEEELALQNLVTHLVKVEKSPDELEVPIRFEDFARRLLEISASQGLVADVVRWLIRSFLPDKFPEADIPQVTDISEVQRMLAENVVQWKDKWVEQGIAQGVEQGIAQGVEQGIAQGVEQGERKLFRRTVELRFGAIPSDLSTKIDSASTTQIEQWAELLFDAKDINSIFG